MNLIFHQSLIFAITTFEMRNSKPKKKKREEEYMPALKRVLMHRYKSRTLYKKSWKINPVAHMGDIRELKCAAISIMKYISMFKFHYLLFKKTTTDDQT